MKKSRLLFLQRERDGRTVDDPFEKFGKHQFHFPVGRTADESFANLLCKTVRKEGEGERQGKEE